MGIALKELLFQAHAVGIAPAAGHEAVALFAGDGQWLIAALVVLLIPCDL